MEEVLRCEVGIKSRFSAGRIQEIMHGLTPRQQGFVEKYGFGHLKRIGDFSVHEPLVEWIMGKVNPPICEFRHSTKAIVFSKPLVQKILGVPAGERPFVMSGTKTDRIEELRAVYKGGTNRATIPHATSLLINNEDEESFMRTFLLIVLAAVFTPSTANTINLDYLWSLEDISAVQNLDWSGHIIEHLMGEVMKFQRKHRVEKQKAFWLGGCLPLLAIAYMDHLDLPKGRIQDREINYSLPGICHVSQDDFKFAAVADLNRLHLHFASFGKCPFRGFDKTPYSDNPIIEEVEVEDSAKLLDWLRQSGSGSQGSQMPPHIQEQFDKHSKMWEKDIDDYVVSLAETMKSTMKSMLASRMAALMMDISPKFPRENQYQTVLQVPSSYNFAATSAKANVAAKTDENQSQGLPLGCQIEAIPPQNRPTMAHLVEEVEFAPSNGPLCRPHHPDVLINQENPLLPHNSTNTPLLQPPEQPGDISGQQLHSNPPNLDIAGREACEEVSISIGDEGGSVSDGNKDQLFEDDVVCSPPNVPFIGMEFNTLEEAEKVYSDYAYKVGFRTRVACSKKSQKRGSTKVISRTWECVHAKKEIKDDSTSASNSTSVVTNEQGTLAMAKKQSGTSVDMTVARKRNRVKRYDCKAHMIIGLRDGRWRVALLKMEHTHPLVKEVKRRKHNKSP